MNTSWIKPILLVLGGLTLSIFIHPSLDTHEAQISGRVLDGAGHPVSGALVRRVSRKDITGFGGSVTTRRVYSDSTLTDANGRYDLPGQDEWTWFHSPMSYAMAWVHCYADLEVSAPGRQTFTSEFGDKDLYFRNDERLACNGVRFEKVVVLDATPSG